MMVKRLILAVVFTISCAAVGHAQVRAAHFDGLTRLFNPGSLGGPSITRALACSFWYNSTITQSTVIMDASSHLHIALMIAFTHDIGGIEGGLRLAVVAGNFDGSHQSIWVGGQPLPTDDRWKKVSFTLSTSLQLATWSLDQFSGTWDPDLGHLSPMIFDIPVSGNHWTVGASAGSSTSMGPLFAPLYYEDLAVSTAVAHYTGDLAELTCHFGDTDYTDILTPNRTKGGYAELVIQNNKVEGVRPLELGYQCSAVFEDPAILCMRGDALRFKFNNGGATAFVTVEGNLVDAPDDPFSLWP
jgi:hypothetical protein